MNCSCVCSLFHQLDVQKPTVILSYPSPNFGQPKNQYLAILLVTCFGMVSFKVTNPDLLLRLESPGTSGSPTSPSFPKIMGVYLETPHEPRKKKTTLLSMGHAGWLMTGSWILLMVYEINAQKNLGRFLIPPSKTQNNQNGALFFHCSLLTG